MMKYCLAAFAALFAAASVQAAEPSTAPQHLMEDVRILSYGAPPPDSGVLRTLRKIATEDGMGVHQDVFITWLGEGQAMPPIGAICDIGYHEEPSRGFAPVKGQIKVVDDFTCEAVKP